MPYAFILISTLVFALAAANSIAKYFRKDFQQILKTVLEAKAPLPIIQILVFSNRPCERPFNACFLNLYYGTTHIECYNLCYQCKEYFATIGAKKHIRVSFIANFF